MKRLLAILAAAMMLFAAAGCSQDGGSSSKAGTDTSGGAAGAMDPIAKEDIKVGVIHIGEPADGAGYSYAHDQGIVEMQKNIGLSDDQIVRKNSVADNDAAGTREAITACIEEGCNIIFGTSWGYMDVMADMAEEHPDVIFCHASGNKSNDRNFNNYFGRIYQARFLTGIAAGLKTQSDKIGFVGAMGQDNAEVTGGIDAFALGVAAVNPDAKIYVKVTNSWFDPTAEKQAAEALLDMGCDVIAQHCDTTAPQLAAQEKGVWGCGYNSDMTESAPKAHLTAPIWHWGAYYTSAVKEVIEGTWKPVNYFGGMAEGFIDISPLTANCAEGTQAKIDEVSAKIKDGSFKVFEGEIKDNQGNIVNKAGDVIPDGDITGKMNWYFETVVVK